MRIVLGIHPGSLWVSYPVKDVSRLASLLPAPLRLCKCKLVEGDADEYRFLFNAYTVGSSVMKGQRLDVQTFAEHEEWGTKHLVLVDCLTNTLDWSPCKGIHVGGARIATGRRGSGIYFAAAGRGGKFHLRGRQGKARNVDHAFAVEGNRQVYHFERQEPWCMAFDEALVASPIHLLSDVVVENTLWKEYRDDTCTHAFLHRHPMHFSVDWEREGASP